MTNFMFQGNATSYTYTQLFLSIGLLNLDTLNSDEFLLSEFKKALQKHMADPVINLDNAFPHRVDLFARVHEEILEKIGNRVPPHKWSYYRIGLIKEGSADYCCGMYKFKAHENTLVIMPPRVINSSSNWSPESKGYFVLFNLDFFLQSHFPHKYLENKKILQSSVQPFIYLNKNDANSIELIFKTILEEKRENNSHKKEMIALKIIELLILCERLYSEGNHFSNNDISSDIVKKFSDLVEKNFNNERSVTFYASQLHVHPNYLNSVIKSHTGLTAKESIQSRITLEAKYLLHTTGLSIKEVAHQLGFDDPNYFSSFFKRSGKLSPASYRSSFI